MAIGEVFKIDDVITGFDLGKPKRPCMVVVDIGPPRGGVLVVPRSTRGSTGVFVPAGALPGLDQPGRFQFLPRYVSADDLTESLSLGILGEPYRSAVLNSVNDVAIEYGDGS